jgi:dCMP deaminase
MFYNPKWQKYFMGIAHEVKKNSNCRSRKIGAVLVRDKSIIATGYNGPARGISPCWECFRKDDKSLALCPAAHAEANCIANAARMGVCTMDSVMFVTCEIPCKDCLSILINAGVNLVYISENKFYDQTSSFILSHDEIKTLLCAKEVPSDET